MLRKTRDTELNKTPLWTLQEKAMAPHCSTLAWKIPWTEEPGGLQSMGLLRVRHYWATSLWLFTFMHWRWKWQPTPVFLPREIPGMEEPGGLPSMGSHRVGHDWSDLAAAAAAAWTLQISLYWHPAVGLAHGQCLINFVELNWYLREITCLHK